MFDNIGKKCMGLAKVVCWLGIIGSCLGAIGFFIEEANFEGVVVLIAGVLTSWIGSWALYAIGETAEDARTAAYYSAHSWDLSGSNTSSISSEPKTSFKMQSTDESWTCVNCNTENPANNTKCRKCGKKMKL